MQEEKMLIEFHVLSSERDTLLDIDCEVNSDTTVLDFLEIIFNNYELIPECITALYAYIPPHEDPVKLHSDQCECTFEELSFSNGTVLRVVYMEHEL